MMFLFDKMIRAMLKMKRAPTCPVLLLPASLSSRPPPWTMTDEGAEGRIELFGEAEKV